MNDRVLCLCCGSRYEAAGDCPNVFRLPHSTLLAVEVAEYLRDHGCEHPRPLDVRSALDALHALGR